jgi:radical SAM protein with 4Fe4S-binding SPASM domain
MTDKLENYYQGYDYGARKPVYITEEELRPDQADKLIKSDRFCMLPWIHMHAFPDGRAYSCCLSEIDYPIGNLKQNTLKEIWNSDEYRKMRVNMMNENPSSACARCYEQEENGFFSMRNSANKNFGQHIGLLDQTKEDGTLDEFKLRYYDIRFSNLCNFKCRTCGSIFSSNWYNDEIKAGWKPKNPQIMYAGKDEDDMWEQMLEHIPHLEQIYFAGGEPLIMKEHWKILDELVKREMFHVRLIYNTNFSEMKFKGRDVFEMWKLFECVSIGASLDGSHERGEYIRKGQDWKQTVENRERMLKICPNVDFYVSTTLSLYNAFHVTDFHREWVDLGLIRPMDWNINILQDPPRDRIDVLPHKLKLKAKENFEKHIEWLEPLDSLTRATQGYRSAINFMMQSDNSHELHNFFRTNNTLDRIREEDFFKIFPELIDLRSNWKELNAKS